MKSTLLFAATSTATSVRRAVDSATVRADVATGPAEQITSGWLYGLPNNGTSASSAIPDHFYTEVGFHGTRAGGSQLSDGGWSAGGRPAYEMRFNSTLSTYRTARKYNGTFTLIANDLWGADGGQDDALYPGDDGNFTETELFFDQLISDMRATDLIEGVVIDIWNEPDYPLFWNRTWPQYLDYCTNIPEVKLAGPAAAYVPNATDERWTSWCAAISGNNTIPDVYTWHTIGDEGQEPDWVARQWRELREAYSLPNNHIDVNEYAWPW